MRTIERDPAERRVVPVVADGRHPAPTSLRRRPRARRALPTGLAPSCCSFCAATSPTPPPFSDAPTARSRPTPAPRRLTPPQSRKASGLLGSAPSPPRGHSHPAPQAAPLLLLSP